MTLNPSVAAIAAAAGTTLTAANLLTTNVVRTGPTAAFADTLDTAANIIAALSPGAAGQYKGSFECQYINNTAYVGTIQAGTGVTLTGASAAIPANSVAQLLITVTGAAAVTVNILYRQSTT